MIGWSVRRMEGRGWLWQESLILCCCLVVGLVSKLAAMIPTSSPGSSAAEVRAGDRGGAEYEAYIVAVGGVLSGSTRGAGAVHRSAAIPAFARKYNLACSACHTAWPELNVFGQTFKDNGYQLGNDRDSPIWVNPSYIPFAIRTTPGWRLERTTHQPVDDGLGGTTSKRPSPSPASTSPAPTSSCWGPSTRTSRFGFVPTVADGEGVGIEAAFVRFDNLFKSRWANLKVGKFEMDNMLSEKRGMMLSSNGAFYQSYHFVPAGDGTDFGLGDNQIGAEWLGHSVEQLHPLQRRRPGRHRRRPGPPLRQELRRNGHAQSGLRCRPPRGASGSGCTATWAGGPRSSRRAAVETRCPAPAPTTRRSTGSARWATSSSASSRSFRLFMHASDDKDLAGGTRDATWNSGLVEFHYYVSPQLVFTQRDEIIRMSRQSDPATPKTLGNIDAFTFGYRWYPIMFSRAGLAMVGELSFTKTIGTVPLSGDGVGLDPLTPGTAVRSTSVLLALDFDF